jgi:hypothetical protein
MRHIRAAGTTRLIRHADSGLELTEEGRALALQIVRAAPPARALKKLLQK